jgi:hypothetical protein
VQRAIEQVLFALLLTRLAFKWSKEMHMEKTCFSNSAFCDLENRASNLLDSGGAI